MKRRGFTLMELLIVIIIIGILVTIAIPLYFKAVERGKMAEAINGLGSLRQSEYRYYAQHGFVSTCSNAGLTELDVGDPGVGAAGQVIRYGSYQVNGTTGGSLTGVTGYTCKRNTVDFSGLGGIPAGYTVTMDTCGNVSVPF